MRRIAPFALLPVICFAQVPPSQPCLGSNSAAQIVPGSCLAERISVRDYGAKGDGVADDTAAIQAAVNAVAGGNATITLPSGKYMIHAPIVIPATARNLTIQGPRDARLYVDIKPEGEGVARGGIFLQSYFPDWGTGKNHHLYYDEFPAPIALNTTPAGATRFTCTASCGALRAGDWVALAEGDDPKHDYFRNYAQVTAVDGKTFTVDQPIDWTPGITATHSFGFARITWSTGTLIRGFTIFTTNGAQSAIEGSAENLTVEDMTFASDEAYDSCGQCIAGSWGISGDRIAIRHNTWEAGMYAYANYSTNVSVVDNTFSNIGGNGAAFEMGQGNAHLQILDNRFHNWSSSRTYLIGGNGRDIVIAGNEMEAMNAQDGIITLSYGTQQAVVANNTIRTRGQACLGVIGDRKQPAWNQTFDISFLGNTCDNGRTAYAIYYGVYPDVENLRSIGNDFTNTLGEGVQGNMDAMDKHSWTILGNSNNRGPDTTQQFGGGTAQEAGTLPSRRTSGITVVHDGDYYFTPDPERNGSLGEYWQNAGTLGTLAGVTASTKAGSRQVKVNSASPLLRDMCITLAGVRGRFCISAIDYTANMVTLSEAPAATVSGAAVSFAPPGGRLPLWPADERAYLPVGWSARYTLPLTAKFVDQDAAGTSNFTLPSAAAAGAGKEYSFTDSVSGASVTVTAQKGDMIDGQPSFMLTKQWQSVRLVSDGVRRWSIIAFSDPEMLGNAMAHPPASSSEACTPPRMAYDSHYLYVCTASHTWKRAALSGF